MVEPLYLNGAALRKIDSKISRIAGADVPVLLYGETGTGKEVVARLIHERSSRKSKPIGFLNCAAMPSELVESELFGHARGSFTGAANNRKGLVQEHNGGTLVLDELQEMSIAAQAKFLRLLQSREVRRVGEDNATNVDIRFIVCVNQRPEVLAAQKKLRLDLYYRISVVTFHMWPLRQRKDEIIPLCKMYLKHFCHIHGRVVPEISWDQEQALLNHEWPGNIRQLINEMQRAVLLSESNRLEFSIHAAAEDDTNATEPGLTLLEQREKDLILEMLAHTGGNKLKAADLIGIGRQTLYNKLKKYEIDSPGSGKPTPAQPDPDIIAQLPDGEKSVDICEEPLPESPAGGDQPDLVDGPGSFSGI